MAKRRLLRGGKALTAASSYKVSPLIVGAFAQSFMHGLPYAAMARGVGDGEHYDGQDATWDLFGRHDRTYSLRLHSHAETKKRTTKYGPPRDQTYRAFAPAAKLLTRDEARRIDRESRQAAGACFAKLTGAAPGRRLRSFTEF
jgi:hypothetical protein